MVKVNLFFYFEATPPMLLIEAKESGWVYRLKLDQKPNFVGRGKKRMVHFLVDRVIETKRGLRKAEPWLLNFYVKVNDWDRGLRKFLRQTSSKGFTISIHGNKSCKEMKQEARKHFLGIKYRRPKL